MKAITILAEVEVVVNAAQPERCDQVCDHKSHILPHCSLFGVELKRINRSTLRCAGCVEATAAALAAGNEESA